MAAHLPSGAVYRKLKTQNASFKREFGGFGMNNFKSFAFILILASCSNAPDVDREMNSSNIKKAFEDSNKPKRLVDARNLTTESKLMRHMPVFVELSRAKRYLTPYPGQG